MEVKIFRKDEIPDIADQAVVFYKRFFDFENIKTAFLNSQSFAIAYDSDKIIGIARTIGDGARFTLIVGLVVDPEYRRKGVGTKLIQLLAKNAGTFHINLTTDPNDEGLEDFYEKAGFKLSEGELVFEWLQK